MRSKALKSQVTMLMIVGIVMFIAVGLVLYLSKTAVKKSSQNTQRAIQTTALDTQPIREFVAKCVDKLSKDALVTLGRQGGYIYTDQGGTLAPFPDSDEGVFFIKNNNADVVYNIKPLLLYAPPPYSTSIPEYPWATFPYGPVNQNIKTFNGIFGISSLPPLNSSGGPHSIQTQIETFVDANMGKCLDFSLFKSQGYDLQYSKSRTKAIIGAKDITIVSEIPLKVTNEKTQEKADMKDFSTILNVRLKDMHYFIKELIDKDISQVTFNLGDSANSKNSFNVKVYRNEFKNDDLISIKDEESPVYGQPFEYVFGRKNRAPALYYIKDFVLAFPPGYSIYGDDITSGSELNGEDPDEDIPAITIEAQLPDPKLPTTLDRPQITFKVTASDGQLSDYQIITVNRK